MSSREDTPEPGTSAASASQAAPAAPQDDNQESPMCLECQGISTACSSSCRHCFCQLCLWDWSLGEAACPHCHRPTRHPYPQHVSLYHEVQDRVYDSKHRRRGRSSRQPRSCSGHLGHGRPWERRQRRGVGWPRNGRRQSWHSQGSGSPRRRWWQQQRRAWEDTPEEGGTPRFEWAIPASSQEHQSQRVSCRSWSQQEWLQGHRRWSRDREHSHGWDRQQSRSSQRDQGTQTGSHNRSTRQRRWRSWGADDRHTARPPHEVPSERSETQPWEDSDSSRQWHTRGRRTRGRSHRRGQNSQAGSQGMVPHDHFTNQRHWRSCNAEERHSSRPQHDTPSRRSRRLQWEDQDSSRQQHTTRSQTRGRSHRRGQNSQTASQGTEPPNRSTRQRQWRSCNANQGRVPRPQRDIPGSSGRSQHQRRRWSHARHRDT